MRKFLFSFLEILEIIIIAVVAVLLVRTYIVQPFLVWGSSMVPSFLSGDYILIDELSLRFRNPQRGEVVVFRYPQNPSTYFIKRIIGLPGERVLIKDNKITIFNNEYQEGFVLNEPYLKSNFVIQARPNKPNEFVLGPDEYFVLGDNRQYSYDSRDWGPLKMENIIGIAKLRLWPIKEVSVFAAPSY
jgi:signal peptidase I